MYNFTLQEKDNKFSSLIINTADECYHLAVGELIIENADYTFTIKQLAKLPSYATLPFLYISVENKWRIVNLIPSDKVKCQSVQKLNNYDIRDRITYKDNKFYADGRCNKVICTVQEECYLFASWKIFMANNHLVAMNDSCILQTPLYYESQSFNMLVDFYNYYLFNNRIVQRYDYSITINRYNDIINVTNIRSIQETNHVKIYESKINNVKLKLTHYKLFDDIIINKQSLAIYLDFNPSDINLVQHFKSWNYFLLATNILNDLKCCTNFTYNKYSNWFFNTNQVAILCSYLP